MQDLQYLQLQIVEAVIYYLMGSNFTNSFGVCVFLTKCSLVLGGKMVFVNNNANSGAALYLDGCTANISDGAHV